MNIRIKNNWFLKMIFLVSRDAISSLDFADAAFISFASNFQQFDQLLYIYVEALYIWTTRILLRRLRRRHNCPSRCCQQTKKYMLYADSKLIRMNRCENNDKPRMIIDRICKRVIKLAVKEFLYIQKWKIKFVNISGINK